MIKNYYWAIVLAAAFVAATLLTVGMADAKPEEKPEPQGPLNEMTMFQVSFGETLTCSPTNDILVHVLTTLFGDEAGMGFSNDSYTFSFTSDQTNEPGIVSFTQGVDGGSTLQVSSQGINIVAVTIQSTPQTQLGCEITTP